MPISILEAAGHEEDEHSHIHFVRLVEEQKCRDQERLVVFIVMGFICFDFLVLALFILRLRFEFLDEIDVGSDIPMIFLSLELKLVQGYDASLLFCWKAIGVKLIAFLSKIENSCSLPAASETSLCWNSIYLCGKGKVVL